MAKRTYTTIEGEPLTRDEYCDYTGLAVSTVNTLYTEYEGDVIEIALNHGKHSGKVRKRPVDPNSVKWHTVEGEPLSYSEFCEYIDLFPLYVMFLYRQNGDSVEAVLANHGKHKKKEAKHYKYKFKDGSPAIPTKEQHNAYAIVGKKYGYTYRAVVDAFNIANGDYKKAYEILEADA